MTTPYELLQKQDWAIHLDEGSFFDIWKAANSKNKGSFFKFVEVDRPEPAERASNVGQVAKSVLTMATMDRFLVSRILVRDEYVQAAVALREMAYNGVKEFPVADSESPSESLDDTMEIDIIPENSPIKSLDDYLPTFTLEDEESKMMGCVVIGHPGIGSCISSSIAIIIESSGREIPFSSIHACMPAALRCSHNLSRRTRTTLYFYRRRGLSSSGTIP